MKRFLDTSALIATCRSRDREHRRAIEQMTDDLNQGIRYTVGRPVLIEFIDGLTKRVNKHTALIQLDRLETSAMIRIEPDIEEDHVIARDYFEKYHDQRIDLTDCLSFAMAERLGIEEVFTFDNDFATHGFIVFPRV